MIKGLIAASAIAISAVSAQAAPLLMGSTFETGLFIYDVDQDGYFLYGDELTPVIVTDAEDGTFYPFTLDANVGGSDQFLISVEPGEQCILFCEGDYIAFGLFGLQFENGEKLVDFIVTEAIRGIFDGYQIIDDSSIAFFFYDRPFGEIDAARRSAAFADNVFLSGNFVTAPAAVPLPAAGGLLLAGMGLLGAFRLRGKRAAAKA